MGLRFNVSILTAMKGNAFGFIDDNFVYFLYYKEISPYEYIYLKLVFVEFRRG